MGPLYDTLTLDPALWRLWRGIDAT